MLRANGPSLAPICHMARVLGQGGRYPGQEARKKEHTLLIVGCLAIGLLSWISGFITASALQGRRMLLGAGINGIGLLATFAIYFWFDRRLDVLAKQRQNYRQGEAGEIAIANELQKLPETYFVIHGLKTPTGDVDHIVVGPTGIFALDTKNWKGTVAADKSGELLINGARTDKPSVRQFVARVMEVREKVKSLCENIDPFIKAVFVFTSARVDANWGSTGALHCIRNELLNDYILNNKPLGGTLSRTDTKAIARALKALVEMDPEQGTVAHPATQAALAVVPSHTPQL
jgi:hypothetical protein